jgi:hypothetical protein
MAISLLFFWLSFAVLLLLPLALVYSACLDGSLAGLPGFAAEGRPMIKATLQNEGTTDFNIVLILG